MRTNDDGARRIVSLGAKIRALESFPRAAKSDENRVKIARKTCKSRPKPAENRRRSDLGRFGAIKVVQGTATDAPKTAQERSETRPGRPKSAPERPKTGRGASKTAPRPLSGRSGERFEQYCVDTARRKRVRNDFPTAGCCENHSFYCVFPLAASDSCARGVRAKMQAFRPPKSVPRAAKTPRNRARAAFGERKIALERAMYYRFFLSEAAEASQSAVRAQ